MLNNNIFINPEIEYIDLFKDFESTPKFFNFLDFIIKNKKLNTYIIKSFTK